MLGWHQDKLYQDRRVGMVPGQEGWDGTQECGQNLSFFIVNVNFCNFQTQMNTKNSSYISRYCWREGLIEISYAIRITAGIHQNSLIVLYGIPRNMVPSYTPPPPPPPNLADSPITTYSLSLSLSLSLSHPSLNQWWCPAECSRPE